MKKWIINHPKNNQGFTLLEILLAAVALGIIGIVLSDTLARSFRSSDKIELISNIKQNGQNAMNTLDSTIRNSQSVVCIGDYPAGSTKKVIVVEKSRTDTSNTGFTRFRIVTEDNAGAGKNGYIIKESPSLADPNSLLDRAALCDPVNPLPSPLDSFSLTNRDLQTGVSVKSGDFTLIQNPDNSKPTVIINFNLGSAANAGNKAEENLEDNSITFKTTVILR